MPQVFKTTTDSVSLIKKQLTDINMISNGAAVITKKIIYLTIKLEITHEDRGRVKFFYT